MYEGRAELTGPGGLRKSQLKKNSRGKIVSKKQASRPLNAYMKLANRARKEGWEEFDYNGNRYTRDFTATGMVIFRRG